MFSISNRLHIEVSLNFFILSEDHAQKESVNALASGF